MIVLNEDLKKYYRNVANDRFIQISKTILSWKKLKKWHRINLVLSESNNCFAEIRSFGDQYPMVLEISYKLLYKIDTICNKYQQNFINCYSAPLKEDADEVFPISSHFLRNCLFDTTLQFIIAHELSHVLCGHLSIDDKFYDSIKQEYGIDNEEVDSLIYYILEMDADGTASNIIYWGTNAGNYIFNTLLATAWIPEVNSQVKSIHHLSGIHLKLALRTIIMVKLIAFTVLEESRKKVIGEKHPMPSVRLLSAVNTIGLEYSFNVFKDKQPTVVDKFISVSEYISSVLKPVITEFLEIDLKTSNALIRQLYPKDSKEPLNIEDFIKEYFVWCSSGKDYSSIAITELEKTRVLRDIVDVNLKPLRYLEYMGFSDINKL